MRQEKRGYGLGRPFVLLGLAAAAVIVATLFSLGGCGRSGVVSRDTLPGVASKDYWVWPELKIEDTLTAPSPATPRWTEFVKAAAAHAVLLYDFQYGEGETVAAGTRGPWPDNPG